jgi:hypothetical protein
VLDRGAGDIVDKTLRARFPARNREMSVAADCQSCPQGSRELIGKRGKRLSNPVGAAAARWFPSASKQSACPRPS